MSDYRDQHLTHPDVIAAMRTGYQRPIYCVVAEDDSEDFPGDAFDPVEDDHDADDSEEDDGTIDPNAQFGVGA